MRNPLKPKNKSRRFAELQEDTGFSAAQFETPETPSNEDNSFRWLEKY